MRKTLIVLFALMLIPSIGFSQPKIVEPAAQPTKPKLSEEEIRTGRVDFINASNLPASQAARQQSYESGKSLAKDVVANGQ